ncbi:MAG: GWxTD domain-containing protein, partial [Bacteroidota bacterium]
MKIAWSRPQVLGEPLDISEERLYLLQKDTTTLEGVSFQYITQSFPKYDNAATLLEPTLYLSSRREQAAMLEAPDQKTALDQFWLGAALQSPQKARTAIRYYYRAITKVNAEFTTYKEGWKTDMGMVMTVFGPPTEVYRETNQERWVFRIPPNQQEVVFVFDKIKN